MPINLSNLKVALVHDDLTQYGGGEKMFLAIKELFPTAAIYTSMATREWIDRLGGRRPHTSFMQRLPFKKRLERAYFPLYPLAFESFDLSGYDLVVSSSSRFAHGIVTRPETKHICYMHSPGRQFWESGQYFGAEGSKLGRLLSPMLSYLRLWDYAAAQRVDHFIANSEHIAEKIGKYYHREASVVYPFVDLGQFELKTKGKKQKAETADYQLPTNGYYLVVTRLASWKRVDIAVEAALRVGVRLRVVGDGPDRKHLEALVNSKWKMADGGIEFMGRVSDEELVGLYRGCRAFIMTQKEDFGIAPLEAQAMGKPVIAFRAGGALETVVEGKTGEFFYPQTPNALAEVLKSFEPKRYDPKVCRRQAERFSKEVFMKKFKDQIEKLVAGSW